MVSVLSMAGGSAEVDVDGFTLKIGIAHGQMKATQLEDVIHGFLSKKYDVLLSTKIIESSESTCMKISEELDKTIILHHAGEIEEILSPLTHLFFNLQKGV